MDNWSIVFYLPTGRLGDISDLFVEILLFTFLLLIDLLTAVHRYGLLESQELEVVLQYVEEKEKLEEKHLLPDTLRGEWKEALAPVECFSKMFIILIFFKEGLIWRHFKWKCGHFWISFALRKNIRSEISKLINWPPYIEKNFTVRLRVRLAPIENEVHIRNANSDNSNFRHVPSLCKEKYWAKKDAQ